MIRCHRAQPGMDAQEGRAKSWNVILTELRTDEGLVGYAEIQRQPTNWPRMCEWVSPNFGEIVHGMGRCAPCGEVWRSSSRWTSPRAPAHRGPRTGLLARCHAAKKARPRSWRQSRDRHRPCGDIKGKSPGEAYRYLYRTARAARTDQSSLRQGGYYSGRIRPIPIAAQGGLGDASSELGYRAVKLKTGAGKPSWMRRSGSGGAPGVAMSHLLMIAMNAPTIWPGWNPICPTTSNRIGIFLARGSICIGICSQRFRAPSPLATPIPLAGTARRDSPALR